MGMAFLFSLPLSLFLLYPEMIYMFVYSELFVQVIQQPSSHNHITAGFQLGSLLF